MLRPLVGLHLDGATLAENDDIGGVGSPAWGPSALLRDLELRLGLVGVDTPAALRLDAWLSRLKQLMHSAPFYARSLSDDPLGTATVLLVWRDALVDGGWNGTPVPGGGPRLATMAAVEALTEPRMLPSAAERLVDVEVALGRSQLRVYDHLAISDERNAWPGRWKRVFDLLAESGTTVTRIEMELRGAPPETDLGRLQHVIQGLPAECAALRGDGSLILLECATTLEAADSVAAVLQHHGERGAVVILGGGEERVLDEALAAYGLGTLGTIATERGRAPAQLLPLALELLFDPIDPHRALDLITMAVGPFASTTRHMLSRALSDAPGIGGRRWRSAKVRLREVL